MAHDHIPNRTRLTRRTFLAAGLTATLAACTTGNESASNPKVLDFWDYQQQPEKNYLKRLSDFTAKTGVKINRRVIKYEDYLAKILQAAAARQLPDVIMIDNPWNSSLAEQGVLEDLTSRVKAWGQWDNFYPGPAASATWKGKIYGVPNESNALTLYYDKTLFDQKHIPAPTTWDELSRIGKALTEGKRYGVSAPMTRSENSVFLYEAWLWQAGADLGSLRSPAALRATDHLKSLVSSKTLSTESLSWDLRGSVTELVNGRSAMAFGGTWDCDWVFDNMGNGRRAAVTTLPKGPKSAASNLGGESWTIASTSTKKDTAWQLLEFALDKDRQMPYLVESGQLPSRKDLASRSAFLKDPYPTLLKQLNVAEARVYGPDYPRMSDALINLFQSVVSGQSTPADALDKAAKAIEPLLAA
ncbi:ABC transporter substrate-binding protein [Acidipropionibacterium virtanenii]|uniref:Lactose-binding protein n=1 Tax=Acidipropionibacterium virtanenii TaxID=2057246 RepID=A0A344UQW8_9ACTN|nr:sugar ABC transporter substrate-binding protein [Acidipropionibacterium virtanenii]AXE37666.1 Lactose-binding protein [Acidipropionibacterium virtanenii]